MKGVFQGAVTQVLKNIPLDNMREPMQKQLNEDYFEQKKNSFQA